jgi:DMSO/TMAO reductase YedYZ heme-binding membrane subunit
LDRIPRTERRHPPSGDSALQQRSALPHPGHRLPRAFTPAPLDNSIGAIALYLLAFVVVTSYLRLRLGRHLWKSFLFSIYFAAAALFWHSLFTDPSLKNAPVDWFEGGKLFVESCLLLIAAISLLRLRYARKKALRARQSAQRTAPSA